ncbi:MAG: amidohydrolase family protein, partial [Thermoanaerobaculia bacterium]
RSVLPALLLLAGSAGAVRAADPMREEPIEPPYYAIEGARIVPVSGPVIEDGTIVVARGLIQAVGADVEVPPEARVIDGAGLVVYPGLVDGLSDLGLRGDDEDGEDRGRSGGGPPGFGGGPSASGPEDRPATTPWKSAAHRLSLDDGRLETWREGGFSSAVVAPDEGIVQGQAAFVNLAGQRPRELVVETPVALRLGLQPPGGFGSFPSSLFGVVSYLEQLFLDAAHYHEAWNRYEADPVSRERPHYDRALEALLQAVDEGRPVLLPATNAVEIRRAVALGERLKAETVVYGGHGGYAVAGELAAADVPVLVSLDWPEAEPDRDPEADTPLRVLRFRHRAPSTPAAFEEAGVRYGFTADGLASPRAVLEAVREAVDAGLSPDAAIRALTLGVAEIYGVDDRLGSLDPGKIANLAVADGDLLAEGTKVKMVFVDGRPFEVAEAERPEEPPAVDVTGRWELSVETPRGVQEATADLEMDEDGTLSGTVEGESASGQILDGWVAGDRFRFTVSMTMGGRAVEATYSGTVEEDRMEGSVSMGPFTAELTGRRPGAGWKEAA